MWGMQLVGITGGIGHGKSTLAVDLAACAPKSKHFESSGIIIEVINAWRSARPLFPTDSSIEQINHARGLYDDLQSGQLQPQYDARDYANA
jgi:dephospho-CoA kinase